MTARNKGGVDSFTVSSMRRTTVTRHVTTTRTDSYDFDSSMPETPTERHDHDHQNPR